MGLRSNYRKKKSEARTMTLLEEVTHPPAFPFHPLSFLFGLSAGTYFM